MTEELGKKSVYGRELGSFKMKCPFCGGDMIVKETEYEVPGLGKVILVSRRCTRCGYRKNEVIPLKSEGHKRIYLRVEDKEDFKAKITRSPFARILVPELGLEMTPGIDAEIFVTNVEGVLRLFLDAAERIRAMEGGELSEAEKELRRRVENLEGGFTVVIDDREGISSVSGARQGKVVVEEVDGRKADKPGSQ